jgi:hypothetical protein
MARHNGSISAITIRTMENSAATPSHAQPWYLHAILSLLLVLSESFLLHKPSQPQE